MKKKDKYVYRIDTLQGSLVNRGPSQEFMYQAARLNWAVHQDACICFLFTPWKKHPEPKRSDYGLKDE